ELGYTHPLEGGWTLEARLRGYSQTAAAFYRDLFPRAQFQNFIARDKELSTFDSTTLRLGASYDVLSAGWKFVERGTVSIAYDRITFEYADFRDVTRGGTPGEEPMYGFDADVVQVFMSFWF